MKVFLVEVSELPPGLAGAVLGGLPPPFAGGETMTAAFDLERCFDRARAQVDAACLIELLPHPPPGSALLGLTGADLFLSALAYVFGLSPVGTRRGVLSWARLRPEAGGGGGREQLQHRVVTEAVHELGHALGLVHCPVTECAMHRSLWPEAVDLKAPIYCPSCAVQLQALLQEQQFRVPR